LETRRDGANVYYGIRDPRLTTEVGWCDVTVCPRRRGAAVVARVEGCGLLVVWLFDRSFLDPDGGEDQVMDSAER
jgi:hypothetical protein